MAYTIIVNNRSYDLPKKTISVMEDLDSALKVDRNKNLSLREKYSQLHEFVKQMIGEEKAKECFGSDNLDEIDLSELAITVSKIHTAYNKPIEEHAIKEMRERLGKVPMEKVTPMVAAIDSIVEKQL